MPKHVLKNASLVVNAVDLSDHVRSITITTERPEVDVTAMGAVNTQIVLGIGDASIDVEFYQDYDAAKVDATLWPLAGTDTPFTVVVKPTTAAVSATNPSFTMSALLPAYSPIAGGVGDANTVTVTFRNAAQTGLVRAVA